MNNFFLYTDIASQEILLENKGKRLLLGGDFGYSNFGDVLQLRGAIKKSKDQNLEPIVIYNLDSITDINYINRMKLLLNVNIIIFISYKNIDFSDVIELKLSQLKATVNIYSLHLYGGGYLNAMWGDYMLSLSEYFIDLFKIHDYRISGQQLESEYIDKFISHLNKTNPVIVGVRDFDSLALMELANYPCYYSFDDATEELLNISKKVSKNQDSTNTFLIHLNFSKYTDSNNNIESIINKLNFIKREYPNYSINVFNAYNDNRYDVQDTLKSLIFLENRFPYKKYTVIDGGAVAYDIYDQDYSFLSSEFAISSSYHTTLLMGLSNIPCYLFTNNRYYEQKGRSLKTEKDFYLFLDKLPISDFSENIEMRAKWNTKFDNINCSNNRGI